MKAQCDGCSGFFDTDDCELVVSYDDDFGWVQVYQHGWQVAVDNFKYCGPIIVFEEDDDENDAD